MKFGKRSQSSGMFLLELIFAILFFAVASSVCVQFFVKAHTMSVDASALNHAVGECSSVMEIVCSQNDIDDICALIEKAYPDGSGENSGAYSYVVSYNDDFEQVPGDSEDVSYTMVIDLVPGENTVTVKADVADKNGGEVYSLSLDHYLQRGNAE